jgi:hypothetical protein
VPRPPRHASEVSGAHTIDDLEVEKSLRPAPFQRRVIGAPFYIPPAHSGCPSTPDTYLIRMNAEKRLVKGRCARASPYAQVEFIAVRACR